MYMNIYIYIYLHNAWKLLTLMDAAAPVTTDLDFCMKCSQPPGYQILASEDKTLLINVAVKRALPPDLPPSVAADLWCSSVAACRCIRSEAQQVPWLWPSPHHLKLKHLLRWDAAATKMCCGTKSAVPVQFWGSLWVVLYSKPSLSAWRGCPETWTVFDVEA